MTFLVILQVTKTDYGSHPMEKNSIIHAEHEHRII